MYYTHEYSEKAFDDYDDCEDDLILRLSDDDYLEYLPCKSLIHKFLWRTTNDEFCNWFESVLFEIEHTIANELITEHEDEENEHDWDKYHVPNMFELNP